MVSKFIDPAGVRLKTERPARDLPGPTARTPLFLSVVLTFLSVINLAAAMRSKSPEKKVNWLDYKQFVIILGLLVLYVFLLEPLGYVISTFLFLMAGFQTMEKGAYGKSALIAAVFSGGIYYIYVEVALGVLPGLPFLEQ